MCDSDMKEMISSFDHCKHEYLRLTGQSNDVRAERNPDMLPMLASMRSSRRLTWITLFSPPQSPKSGKLSVRIPSNTWKFGSDCIGSVIATSSRNGEVMQLYPW